MVKMVDLPGARYVVEDDIPIPARQGDTSDEIAVLCKLKVGQSVMIPAIRSGVVWNASKRSGFKFTQRTFTRGLHTGKMRVWRIE